MAELARRDGIAAKALAFAILTAARSGEVRGMTWAEIDDADSVWTVPADAHEGRQGASRAADARGAWRCSASAGQPDALVFPSPTNAEQAAVRHDADGRAAAHGARRSHRARVPLDLPRLGRRDHGASARGDRGGAGAPAEGQGRGRLCPRRPVREAARLMEDWAAFLARPAGEVICDAVYQPTCAPLVSA